MNKAIDFGFQLEAEHKGYLYRLRRTKRKILLFVGNNNSSLVNSFVGYSSYCFDNTCCLDGTPRTFSDLDEASGPELQYSGGYIHIVSGDRYFIP